MFQLSDSRRLPSPWKVIHLSQKDRMFSLCRHFSGVNSLLNFRGVHSNQKIQGQIFWKPSQSTQNTLKLLERRPHDGNSHRWELTGKGFPCIFLGYEREETLGSILGKNDLSIFCSRPLPMLRRRAVIKMPLRLGFRHAKPKTRCWVVTVGVWVLGGSTSAIHTARI